MTNLSDIMRILVKETGISLSQTITIFNAFIKNSDDYLHMLRDSIASNDFDKTSKYAHQLKGTAANLRLPILQARAVDLEKAANSQDRKTCATIFNTILNLMETIKRELQKVQKFSQLRVLIVEDNDMNGKMLTQMIKNLGHEVVAYVATPEQALLSVKKHMPDVVFMDIDLPTEMNGIETAELISGYHKIPVVFISIYDNQEIIAKAKPFGIGYVVKPFMASEIDEMLTLAIEKVISKQNEVKPKEVKLKVKDESRTYFVNFADVVYFESRLHQTIVYTEFKSFELRISLKELLQLDELNYFIQTHRSFLVNRNYLIGIINDAGAHFLRLKSALELIPVSRNNLRKVKTALAQAT